MCIRRYAHRYALCRTLDLYTNTKKFNSSFSIVSFFFLRSIHVHFTNCHNNDNAYIVHGLTFLKYTCYRDGIKDVSVTLVPLAYDKTDNNINEIKKVSVCL